MKILIAPDSYKESMSAFMASTAIREGIQKVLPEAQCTIVPMADGGEGTADCLMYQRKGEQISCHVVDPLGAPIDTAFTWFGQTRTAVIEVAKACGIMLIKADAKDPLTATSYGVGEIIKKALEKGSQEIILTLGGTVTNDGGSGMLQALGGKLLDVDGKQIAFGAGHLHEVEQVDLSEPIRLLQKVKVTVLCDVKNQLLGDQGATYVFGPQKGVTKGLLKVIESAMEHYAKQVTKDIGRDITKVKGSGAAGGLGFALFAVSNAQFKCGADYVMENTDFEKKIKDCDFVITGEGSIDAQSLQGKVPIRIAQMAKKYGKPVYVFVGKQSGPMEQFYENGITAVFCILRSIKSMEQVLNEAEKNLRITVENFTRVIAAMEKKRE